MFQVPKLSVFNREGDEGFTLLELLVAIAIVSLIVSAAPSVYAKIIPSYELRQLANDIAGAGRNLRARALANGRQGSLSFVAIDAGGTSVLSEASTLEVDNDVLVSFEPEEVYLVGPDNIVFFYPNGATSGGTLSLRRGNLSVEIVFDSITGAIEVLQ